MKVLGILKGFWRLAKGWGASRKGLTPNGSDLRSMDQLKTFEKPDPFQMSVNLIQSGPEDPPLQDFWRLNRTGQTFGKFKPNGSDFGRSRGERPQGGEG